jgi:hypothetical protein
MHGTSATYGIQADINMDLLGGAERAKTRVRGEANGEVHNRSKGWWDSEFHLYASLEILLSRRQYNTEPTIDLPALKAATAAAHPDKGGSNEAFIAARKVYVRARRMARDREQRAQQDSRQQA